MATYETEVTIRLRAESDDDPHPEDLVTDAVHSTTDMDVISSTSNGWNEILAPNREKLISLMEWAGAQQARKLLGLPSEWDQGSWIRRQPGVALAGRCGTAGCLAGKTALEAGAEPHRSRDIISEEAVEVPDELAAKIQHLLDNGLANEGTWGLNGNVTSYRLAAQAELGLTNSQATLLFDGSNRFESVIRIVAGILRGDPEYS